MHFNLPKPQHGWRKFVGEVGVIVIGVLIALGADQFADALNWRRAMAEFRKATNEEIATNLYSYQFRVRQSPCISRRIAELEEWRDRALNHGGSAEQMSGEISRPSLYTIRQATWDSRGDVVAHMSLEERLNYAEAYGVISHNHQQMIEEREAWRNLAAFNGLRMLDHPSAMRLNELLFQVKNIDASVRGNWQQALDFSARLGVGPEPGRRRAYLRPADPQFCKPLFPPA